MDRERIFWGGLVATWLAAGFKAYAARNVALDKLASITDDHPHGNDCPGPACLVQRATVDSNTSASDPNTPQCTVKFIDDAQEIRCVLKPRSYPRLTVQAGLPVRWIISADRNSLDSCNNAISIPALNIYQRLAAGDNIVEFLPQKAGVIPYSCWRGMITATITVTDGLPPSRDP